MKKNFLFLILMFIGQFVFAQMQSYIGIVRPQKNDYLLEYEELENKEIRKSLGIKEKKDSEEDSDNDENESEDGEDSKENKEKFVYDKKIEKNIFGSGFVYVSKSGKNYIFTNRHVILDSDKACIEFINPENGDKTIYEDLDVHILSDDIDVAVLTFPEDKRPFKNGLEFYEKEIQDGDQVYSAGYPALGYTPVWQFASGNVSNAKASIDELIKNDVSTIIQHTAPIDSGNSGGPLLIVDSSSKNGYKVVGINTWKAYYRELAGFTIPKTIIFKYFDDFGKEKNPEEELKQMGKKFSEVLSYNSKNDFTNFISNELIYSTTYKQYDNIKKQLNLDVWEYKSTFVLNTLKNIYKNFFEKKYIVKVSENQTKTNSSSSSKNKNKYNKYSVSEIKKENEREYSITFITKDEKNTIFTKWIKESSIWKLNYISYTEDSALYSMERKYNYNRKYVMDDIFSSKLGNLYFYGTSKTLNAKDNLEDYYWSANYKYLGFNNSFICSPTEILWQYKTDENHLLFSKGVALGFLIKFINLNISPYASINGEFDIITQNPVYGWDWNGGLSIYYKKIGVFVEYTQRYLYYVREDKPNYSYGTLNFGLSYKGDY